MQWHDYAGTLGVTLIVGAYFLLQIGRTGTRSISYSLANAVGAGLVLLSLAFEFNLSAFVIEVFWLAISCIGLVRNYRDRALRRMRFDRL